MLPYNNLNYAMFGIPCPASAAFTYAASGVANDDNVASITYKNDAGTTIGVLAFTYYLGTNNVKTITRTA